MIMIMIILKYVSYTMYDEKDRASWNLNILLMTSSEFEQHDCQRQLEYINVNLLYANIWFGNYNNRITTKQPLSTTCPREREAID
jgi:hypothetical protein